MFVQHWELTGDNECILPNSNNNNHYCRSHQQIHLLKAGAGLLRRTAIRVQRKSPDGRICWPHVDLWGLQN